jgi:tRNA pseudouridine38-40 synthase
LSRIALQLEYDGAAFHGWQSQAGGGTVQDALEAALSRVADGPVAVTGSGRTDSGVHALGQVAHFDAPVDRPLKAWRDGVNANLPAAAAVREARPVADDFHARRTAVARTYCYRILNRSARTALDQHRATWVRESLDAAAMHRAGQALVGRHDFSAFRSAGCQARHAVRIMEAVSVARRGEEIWVTVRANAFLYNMVRIIIACLLQVGRGLRPESWPGELLAAGERSRGADTAPPDGLYLAAVHYPPDSAAPAPPPNPGGATESE